MIYEIKQDKEISSQDKSLFFQIPSIKTNELLSTEMNEKKGEKMFKFITKKRGRKNKHQIIIKLEDKNVHNKFSNDNIKRRIKAIYNKYIIKFLNNIVKKKYKKARIKFLKLNIRITKDIAIEYNRNLLNQQLRDIIVNISNKYKNKDNNRNCIKFIKEQKDNTEIINILNMTYKDFYTEYFLKSTKNDSLDYSFEANKEKLLLLNGKKYLDKFIENAEHFVEFFANAKIRKSRKTQEIDNINIPIENETVETTLSNELNCNENEPNKHSEKKTVSISTQTYICDINSKIIAFL